MNLRLKLILPLSIMMLIMGIMLTDVWFATSKQKDDGLVINLAGRQRMLSQKMTKEMLQFTQAYLSGDSKADASRNAMLNTAAVFDKTLNALKNSGEAPLSLDLAGAHRFCPVPSKAINGQLAIVEDIWSRFYRDLKLIAENPSNADEAEKWILANNVNLLKEMNKGVGMMQAESEAKVSGLIRSQIILLIVGVVFFVFAFIYSQRLYQILLNVANELDTNADGLSAASSEVSDASQRLAEVNNLQTGELDHFQKQISDLVQSFDSNLSQTKTANRISDSAFAFAQEGRESMDSMKDFIQNLEDASTRTANIIKVIDEISFQTNLLALNAAVEAARAGEAGAGFAVVAEEVRNLAMRSSEAAKETAEIISGMQELTNNGISTTENANTVFDKIVDQVKELSSIMAELDQTTTTQNSQISHVNNTIFKMNDYIQSNAASSEEGAAASEELSAQAKDLESQTHQLYKLMGGAAKKKFQ